MASSIDEGDVVVATWRKISEIDSTNLNTDRMVDQMVPHAPNVVVCSPDDGKSMPTKRVPELLHPSIEDI